MLGIGPRPKPYEGVRRSFAFWGVPFLLVQVIDGTWKFLTFYLHPGF